MNHNGKCAEALAGLSAHEENHEVTAVTQAIMAGAGGVKAKGHADAISIFNKANETRVAGTSTWQDALEAIADGVFSDEIAKLRSITDIERRRAFKKTLKGVTFCGTFRGSRAISNIEEPTGFIIPDIDHIEDVEGIFDRLKADPYTWFAFRSPSGDGIKCGFRAEGIKTDADIKAFFASVEDYFLKAYGIEIDDACKDISRLTFLSHDPNAYVAQSPELFPVGCERTTLVQAAKTEFKFDYGIGHERYAMKVLESCCQKISRSLPGEQHGIRLDMAVLAGGYAHYLSDSTVYAALEAAVVASGAENLTAAMATIRDGMAYGKARPCTIPEREAASTAASTGVAAVDAPKTPGLFTDFDMAEFCAGEYVHHVPPAIEYLFDESLPTGLVGFVVGPPAAGKSTLLIHIAASVATGTPFFGDNLFPVRKGKVFCLFCEENKILLHNRIHKITGDLFPLQRDDCGWGNINLNAPAQMYEFGRNVIAVPGAGHDVRLVEKVPGRDAQASQTFHDLLETLKGIEDLALVILDPLSRLYGQNENDNSEATLFVSLLEKIAKETGANVLCSHHVSKNAASDPKTGAFSLQKAMSPDCIRGASALTGAARWQLNLFPMDRATAKKELGQTNSREGQFLVAGVRKNNNGRLSQFYIEREFNTVLRPVEARSKERDDRELWRIVADKVVAAVTDAPADKPFTVRTLTDANCVPWKAELPACSIAVIKAAVHVAIEDGRLVEVEGRNARNNAVTYLAIPETGGEAIPEGSTSIPENTVSIPEGIPEGSTPDTPEDTGNGHPSGINLLNLNEFHTGRLNAGKKVASGV